MKIIVCEWTLNLLLAGISCGARISTIRQTVCVDLLRKRQETEIEPDLSPIEIKEIDSLTTVIY